MARKPRKSKNKAADGTFSAPTQSSVVIQFQKLLQDKGGHFPWAQMLDQKEMKFVYDMIAWAEAKPNFMPTPAQAQWGLQIIKKIEAAAKQWKVAHGGRSKMPSTRADMVARRKAKERLKKSGVVLGKSSPSNLELAMGLHSIGAIEAEPSKKTAKELLISWSKRQS